MVSLALLVLAASLRVEKECADEPSAAHALARHEEAAHEEPAAHAEPAVHEEPAAALLEDELPVATPVVRHTNATHIQVVVPAGVSSGQMLHFTDPGTGQAMHVAVPAGLGQGDAFIVTVPAPAPVVAVASPVHRPLPVAPPAQPLQPWNWSAPGVPFAPPSAPSAPFAPPPVDPSACLPLAGAQSLLVGPRGGPLLPALVFADRECHFKNVEEEGLEDWATHHHDTNRYDVVEMKSHTTVLSTETEWSQNLWGYRKIHVNAGERNVFNIRSTHHTWNPLNAFNRYSYRIMPPGLNTRDDDDALFTVNKGWSLMSTNFLNTYWYVWEGREHHGQCLYSAISNFWSTNVQFFRGCDGFWGPSQDKLVATISRSAYSAGYWMNGMADKFDIHVNKGEDSGLFLAVSIILDATEDHREAKVSAARSRERERERRENRHGLHNRHGTENLHNSIRMEWHH